MKRFFKFKLAIVTALFTVTSVNAQLKLDNTQKVIVGNGVAVGGNKLTVHGDSYMSGTTNLHNLNVAHLSEFHNITSFYSSGVFHGGASFICDVNLNRKTKFSGLSYFYYDVDMHQDLTVRGTLNAIGNVNLNNASINLSDVNNYIRLNNKAYIGNKNTTGNSYPTLTVAGGTESLYSILTYGNIKVAGCHISSDKRFKKDIKDIEGSLDKLSKISGKSYAFKNKEELKNVKWDAKQKHDTVCYIDKNGKKAYRLEKVNSISFKQGRSYGVLAQDLEPVLPELVVYDSLTDTYAVDYIGFIPLLIEGMKEQDLKIQSLEKAVAMLRSKVNGQSQNNGKQKSAVIVPPDQQAILKQNYPNPFNEETLIEFYLPPTVQAANLYIYDLQGKQLKSINIAQRENGSVTIYANELTAGMYKYALLADGEIIGTETMILTE